MPDMPTTSEATMMSTMYKAMNTTAMPMIKTTATTKTTTAPAIADDPSGADPLDGFVVAPVHVLVFDPGG